MRVGDRDTVLQPETFTLSLEVGGSNLGIKLGLTVGGRLEHSAALLSDIRWEVEPRRGETGVDELGCRAGNRQVVLLSAEQAVHPVALVGRDGNEVVWREEMGVWMTRGVLTSAAAAGRCRHRGTDILPEGLLQDRGRQDEVETEGVVAQEDQLFLVQVLEQHRAIRLSGWSTTATGANRRRR